MRRGRSGGVLPSLCSGPAEFSGPVTASQGLAGASRTASPAWRARLLSLHQARGIWKSPPHPLHGMAPVRLRALSLPVLRPTRRDKSCRPCPVSLHSSESGSLRSALSNVYTKVRCTGECSSKEKPQKPPAHHFLPTNAEEEAGYRESRDLPRCTAWKWQASASDQH